MNELWIAIISVTGALLGTLLGSLMTQRMARQSQALAFREQQTRERRESLARALNALLVYRTAETRRAIEAVETGIPVDDVPSASAAREARGTCRFYVVELRILMPDHVVPARYAELVEQAHAISKLPTRAEILAASVQVKHEIEDLADRYGKELSAVSDR